ncbi:putative interferon-induced very large GTPase 1-like, partial [Triplophysa rosa]
SSTDSTVSVHNPARRRRGSNPIDIPNMRIVVLGKDVSVNSGVGNFILGRSAFESESPPDDHQCCERVRGKHMTLINCPHLLQHNLSSHHITQTLRECVSLSHPGPHVIILIFKHDDECSREDQEHVHMILNSFSDSVYEHTLVLTTHDSPHTHVNDIIQEIIDKCLNKHYRLERNSSPSEFKETLENIVQMNSGRHLMCEEHEESLTVMQQTEERDVVKLNVVVCGSDRRLKSFISKLMLNESSRRSDKRSDCVLMKREMEVCGSLINLLELPALFNTSLSDDELTRQTLCCLSLCHPGAHVFLLIVPVGPLTDEHKAEMQEMHRIFSSRIRNHMMILIMQKSEDTTAELDDVTQSVIKRYAAQGHFFHPNTQVSTLLERIQQTVEDNRGASFTTQTFLDEQMKKMKDEETKRKINLPECEECEKGKQEETGEQVKLLKEEREDQLNRRTTDMNVLPQSHAAEQITAYSKLETAYSEWSWTLRSAMLEIENKLQNKIFSDATDEIQETDLKTELKEKSDKVEKSMSEFFEKYQDISIQMKTSLETKIKELQEHIVIEMKRKLNEIIIQHQDLKKEMDAQKTHHENTLFERSKELALKLKDKANDEDSLKTEFDLFWDESVKKIIKETSPIKHIDVLRDVKEVLSDFYESVHVDTWNNISNIFTVQSYSDYVKSKKSSGFTGPAKNVLKAAQEKFGSVLSKEDETKIRTLITDVSYHIDEMIKSFNISKMGYNISYIQQLTSYIKKRIRRYEGRPVKYVFRREFFIDLVFSIFTRVENTFTDQHRMFREARDPDLYLKKKRGEYYSVFQKYCHGATSAAIFGEIICQKLKEPIEQSVYKQTARDLADEMRSNCPSLRGNRSNLEKHILTRLAEEENFDKYMDYIHDPRDHFKSFIRDEVSQYIRDQFSVSVELKMSQNIELLQKKIMTAAHESTQHVEENRGDVDVWLRFFTQKLSDVLIFSVKDFSGVNHDDVDDFKLLEDVIRKELPSIMSDIRSRFNSTFPVNLEYKDRADEILIDHFCRCCWVQCPFCNATCTNTIPNHDGDHSVPFHCVNGQNGWFYKKTTNLSINICTSSVAGDGYFYPNASDDKVPWREYRTAGGVYAEWSITPDLTELPYWKWFVCRFQKDLERHYNRTFQGQGKIPDEWRKITKKEAIESLDKNLE